MDELQGFFLFLEIISMALDLQFCQPNSNVV